MCHVLIIEDEALVAMTIEDLLAREGATSFDFATTQAEAVALAEGHVPAVITSDVRLLEGSGPEAVAEIQSRFGDIPVLFITGTPEDCKPCAPPGRVFAKPFDGRVIARAFREVVDA